MPLPYKKLIDDTLEGRKWENSRLAEELNKHFKLEGDDLVTANEVYEWRRGDNEPRSGFTLAVLQLLDLVWSSPFKFGFRARTKVTK